MKFSDTQKQFKVQWVRRDGVVSLVTKETWWVRDGVQLVKFEWSLWSIFKVQRLIKHGKWVMECNILKLSEHSKTF